MNAMSVSPVKPSISPGNHAVPATPTNLSKNPLPPSNNFAPINLVPESKPVPVVNATPANVENSVDSCSKPPTSNGTVSPTPEANSKESSASTQQNHTENCETAENLSTTDNPPPKPAEVVTEVKSTVEESKPEETKEVIPPKENSEPVKEVKESKKEVVKEPAPPAQSEPVKETSKPDESASKIEEKKEEPVVNNAKEISPPKQSEVSPATIKSEPVPEPIKEVPEPEIEPTADEVKEVKESKESKTKDNTEEEVKKPEEVKTESPAENTPVAAKTTKRKAPKQPIDQVEEDTSEGRKSKRTRLPTQPYQSPIPELQFIAKLQTPAKTTPKPSTEKIIAFYKNEFLAVRNPEGSFYICQTFQNIHKSSTKIKIRWFTNLPQDVFTPDFCDTTEFDCILTNVQMNRVEKDRWKLPDYERTRIENILKRALDVEKGVVDKPSITEEHPDGLDLSLFKDEAQLKKKKKKKSASPKPKKEVEKPKKQPPKPTKPPKTPVASTKKSARLSSLSQTSAKEVEKAKPVETKTKIGKKDKKQGSKKASSTNKQNDKTSAKVWEPSVKSSNSSKVVLSLKKENVSKPETKTTTKRTSSVSSRAAASATSTSPPVPQKRRKEETKPATATQAASSERTGKVRNAGSAVTAKINSAAMRTTKDKERKVSNSSNQRKK